MKTNLLKKADMISDEKGNNVVVSKQEVIQDDGSKSTHLVIEKFKSSNTGVPMKGSTPLWIPQGLVPRTIDAINSLSE